MKSPRLFQHLLRGGSPGGVEPSEVLTDQLLVQRYVVERDEAAFTELVRRHGSMVASVCRRSLCHVHDAEDAFQATFFILARDAARIIKRDSVGSWLFGVAQRITRKARGIRSRQHILAVDLPAMERPAMVDHDQQILEEVAFLPEAYRQPVVLCWLEGHTQQEAAELLGWPIGSVAGRLSRAKEMLRSRLIRRGLCPTALATLYGLSDTAALSAEEIMQTVSRALGQTQGQRVLALAKGGSTMLWPIALIGLLFAGGTGVWWGTRSGAPEGHAALAVSTVEAIDNKETADAMQGDWIVQEGSWGDWHWKGGAFRISIKKEELTFLQANDGDGPRALEGDQEFFQRMQVWNRPLSYQLGQQQKGIHEIDVEFPYPQPFLRMAGAPATPRKPEDMRPGLVRIQGDSLELILASRFDGGVAQDEQFDLKKLPRPKDFSQGKGVLYVKLRRVRPLDRLQGWWQWQRFHEVTRQAMDTEFFVVRDDKCVMMKPGTTATKPLKLSILESPGRLVVLIDRTQGNDDLYDVSQDKIVHEPIPLLMDVEDNMLRMAKFTKMVASDRLQAGSLSSLGGGGAAASEVPCKIPPGANWNNLEQYSKEYRIEVMEYRRSSSRQFSMLSGGAVTTRGGNGNPNATLGGRGMQSRQGLSGQPAPEKVAPAATTIQRIFRVTLRAGQDSRNPKVGEAVQLWWIPRPGVEGVMILDQVTVSEAANLGASKTQESEEQWAVTLQLTTNEARMLELLVDGGRYQVKVP